MNIVIIGYGGMGAYHADRLKKIKDIDVIGAYDIDPARAALAEKDGYVAYKSADAVFADKTVDAVLIATPNDVHPEYVERAAKAGKAALCEKPAAVDTATFDKMVENARKGGTLLEVHQNRRWDSDFLMVQDILASGLLGKLERVESYVMGANGIPGGWRKIKAHGGGMMLDWGVHLIDQLCILMDAPIDRLYCAPSYKQGFDVDDAFTLEMFSGGVSYNCRVDTNSFVSLPRWMLYGSDGTAIIEDWDCHGKIVTAVYGTDAQPVGIQAGNGFTKTMAYRPHESVKEYPLPARRFDNDAFYRNFALTVAGKAQPHVKNDEVRRVLTIMETALCGGEHKNLSL